MYDFSLPPATSAARLASLGFDSFFASAFADLTATSQLLLHPARVLSTSRERCWLAAGFAEIEAPIAGNLREDPPVVGDWVVVSNLDTAAARVDALLPRRTCLVRRAAGREHRAQPLAANIDAVFLVMGLDHDFNLRRLERLAVLAWDSGAQPVVVLTKADLRDDPAMARLDAMAVAPGIPIHLTAATTGEGLAPLAAYLGAASTVTVVGSSGAGKSTLVNALAGTEVMRTGAVREHDQRGQHTTTQRQLIQLPSGAMVIDNPGIREVQLWADEDALDAAFDDLSTLAEGCRFRDCTHHHEPGCAVVEAVAEGRLPADRLAGYRSLQREIDHHQRQTDPRLARQADRRFGRMAREAQEERKRRRSE